MFFSDIFREMPSKKKIRKSIDFSGEICYNEREIFAKGEGR